MFSLVPSAFLTDRLLIQLCMCHLHFHSGYDRHELRTELAQDHRDLRRGTYCPGYSTTSLPLYRSVPTNVNVGTINTFGVRILKHLNTVSVWWHAIGTTSLVIAILASAPKHQSGKFVFRTFIDGTGVDGVGWSQRASPAYVAVIGILLAQYTLTGLNACHLIKHFSLLIEFQASMRVRT